MVYARVILLAFTTAMLLSSVNAQGGVIRGMLRRCEVQKAELMNTISSQNSQITELKDQLAMLEVRINKLNKEVDEGDAGKAADDGAVPSGSSETAVNSDAGVNTGKRRGNNPELGSRFTTEASGSSVKPGAEQNPMSDIKERCKRDCQLGTRATSGLGGGFTCTCPPGYVFDRRQTSCIDVDECLQARACAENELCFNKQGSYECRNTQCDVGFVAQATRLALRCTRSRTNPCSKNADCVNSYSLTFIPLMSNETESSLPRTFYTFSGSVTESQISRPSDTTFTVACENCVGKTQPSTDDFKVVSTGPFAAKVDVLSPFVGPLSILLDIETVIHFMPSFDFRHVTKLIIDVGPCTF